MSLFLKGFVDRNSDSISKKNFFVSETQEYSDGTTLLTGTLSRAESVVTTEGTRLDADSMNSAVLDLVYYELYGIYFDSSLNGERIGYFEDYNHINFDGQKLYGKVEVNDYLDIDLSDQDDSLKIIVIPKEALTSLTSEVEVDYYVNLYSDSAMQNFVVRVRGHINYIPNSTSSND